MSTTLQSTIRRLAEEFSSGILRAVRAASLEEIQGGASAHRGPGRPRGSGRTIPAPARKGVGRPRKNAAAGADTVFDKLVETVKKYPNGIRSEELRAALKVEKVQFRLVAKEAVEAKLIRRTGEKRATTYLPKN